MKAGKGKKKEKIPVPQDILKYEVAMELGLGDKLSRVGWGGLTAEETGRIGGIMTRKRKAQSPGNNISQSQVSE